VTDALLPAWDGAMAVPDAIKEATRRGDAALNPKT
jgi:hypothetical protein